MARKLTAKQEEFCRLFAIDGLNQSQAYRKAYPASRTDGNALYVKASLLMKKDKIRERIEALREKQAMVRIWDKDRATAAMLAIVEGDREYSRDKIQAAKLLNDMWIEKEPEKIEANLIHTVTRRILKDD